MNIEKLISLLGHSSSHPQLDDFLEESGIKKRPKGEDSLVFIEDSTKSVTLSFSARSSYEEDVPEGPRSVGRYILRSVDIERRFSGEMPLGLRWSQNKVQVDSVLGTPLKTAGDLVATYYSAGRMVVVRFTSGGRNMKSFSIFVKDRYDVKRFEI